MGGEALIDTGVFMLMIISRDYFKLGFRASELNFTKQIIFQRDGGD